MRKFWFSCALMVILLAGLPAAAQDNPITISLAVPEFVKEAFSPEVLAEFEAQYPGVRVNLVSSTLAGAAAPAYQAIDTHLEDLQAYVSSADVVLVDNASLSLEGTRAGLFMDLSPLANADPALKADDFLPQAWQSFQWDRGIWALPAAVDVVLLLYNPTAFDAAGITYPSPNWTLDELVNAVRALTKTNAEGEIEPGFFDYGTSGYLVRSLVGAALVDAAAVEVTPDFSSPELARILNAWKELSDEGAVSGVGAGARVVLIGGSADEGPPITIQRSFGLATFPGNPDAVPPAGSLLPGGMAGLEVQGFAVSAGTRFPEMAYELAKFLTNRADIANRLFGSTPARRSLANVEPDSTDPNGGPRIIDIGSLDFSPEAQAVIDQGYASALSVADMLFIDYIAAAFELMETDGLDASAALQQAEAQAIDNLNRAAEFRSTTVVAVATPVPDVPLAPGEIALNFGIASFINPLPNQERWQQIIDQFVANDPEVGRINLTTSFDLAVDSMASQFDCFYLPTNAVPGGNVSNLVSLDPFLDADPNFDRNDLVSSLLEQVRFDNRTWAYPLAIQPEVLSYSPELFTRAGVPLPENGWTIDQFVDALRALKPTADDPAPFIPRDFTGQYLFALIAAFGGLPMDNRTDPPTINFTEPATMDAIRQVLDLAKNGYLDYSEVSGSAGGVNIAIAVGGEEDTDPIYTQTLGAFSFFTRLNSERQVLENTYRYVTYPTGSRYTPISFDINTGYISANAANPDACYRWISTLAQNPDLFSAMPTRRSLIDSGAVAPELAALYRQIDSILSDPNAVVSPSALRIGGGGASIWRQYWLRRAFDRYVLEDADLESELTQAEQFTRDYEQCAAGIPAADPTTQEERFAYFQQFSDCARSVDPTVG